MSYLIPSPSSWFSQLQKFATRIVWHWFFFWFMGHSRSEEKQTCKWIALEFRSDLCIFFYLFHFCIENITFLFPYRVVYQEPVYGNKLLQVWNPDWWKNSSLWLWVCCEILLTRPFQGGRYSLTEEERLNWIFQFWCEFSKNGDGHPQISPLLDHECIKMGVWLGYTFLKMHLVSININSVKKKSRVSLNQLSKKNFSRFQESPGMVKQNKKPLMHLVLRITNIFLSGFIGGSYKFVSHPLL